MKKKSIILVIIALVILLGISAFIGIKYHPNILAPRLANKGSNQISSSSLIFFYGDGCPHCANVEKFFADSQAATKIKFDQKEVFNNQDNADLLGEKAHGCGLNTDSIGVPFLWDGATGKCYVGDEDVISFFKQKLGQ